jgi:endoglucanase
MASDGPRTSRRYGSRLALTILGAILGAISIAGSHPAVACDEPAGTVPRGTIEAASHGFNLSGWLEGPGSAPPDLAVLRSLRRAGMTHIRLPVSAELLMKRFASGDDIKTQLRAVDQALTVLLSIGYRVSVDLHPGGRFSELHRTDPGASMKLLQEAWAGLAPIIGRRAPELVFAELLNEPDIEPARWQIEAEQLAKFVRERLPRTTLIVGPTNWQRADSLPDFHPLSDSNVIYAIHFYDPMVFTHQGHWDPSDPLSEIRGLPFPIVADDPAVRNIRQELIAGGKQRALEMLDRAIMQAEPGDIFSNQLEPAVVWQKTFSRPLIVNEFGMLKGGAPEASRVRWLRSVVRFAEAHCWGWTHWEYGQGFGLLNQKRGSRTPTSCARCFSAPNPPARIPRQINQG